MWLFQPSRAPPLPVALAVALLRPWIKRLEREAAAAEGRKEASQLNVQRRGAKGGETRKISPIPIKTRPTLPLSPRLAFVFPRGATRRSARPLPLRTHSHTQSRLRTLEPCHRLTLSLRAASERRAPRARSACLLPCCRCPLGDRYPPVMSRRACDICIKTVIFNASPALRGHEKPIFLSFLSLLLFAERVCQNCTAQPLESLCDVIKVIDSSSI